MRKVRWAFLTVRLLRVLRVVRIAKLGRFSPGLANFALTLRKSKKHTQMVGVVMLTIIIFFSTLIYFLERDEPNTQFTSIPAAFWWCLFSQTKWVPQTAGEWTILIYLHMSKLIWQYIHILILSCFSRESRWRCSDYIWSPRFGASDYNHGKFIFEK